MFEMKRNKLPLAQKIVLTLTDLLLRPDLCEIIDIVKTLYEFALLILRNISTT